MVGSAVEKHLPTIDAIATTLPTMMGGKVMGNMTTTPMPFNTTSNVTYTDPSVAFTAHVGSGDPLEFVKLEWAMALTFMTGLIQVCTSYLHDWTYSGLYFYIHDWTYSGLYFLHS